MPMPGTMTAQHPQEAILETFDYNGAAVDLVEWTDTIWCGKIGYAANNSDEPNVDQVMSNFQALSSLGTALNGREDGWDVCLSVNYLSAERPNGVMFGTLVATDQRPDGFDIVRVPAARYMRIRMSEETAKALGREMWRGGIPPYVWIGEQVAPKFGYKYGCDALPVFEYYGYYSYETGMHEYCYLYVPVEKA